jgi:hypothetical protein
LRPARDVFVHVSIIQFFLSDGSCQVLVGRAQR